MSLGKGLQAIVLATSLIGTSIAEKNGTNDKNKYEVPKIAISSTLPNHKYNLGDISDKLNPIPNTQKRGDYIFDFNVTKPYKEAELTQEGRKIHVDKAIVTYQDITKEPTVRIEFSGGEIGEVTFKEGIYRIPIPDNDPKKKTIIDFKIEATKGGEKGGVYILRKIPHKGVHHVEYTKVDDPEVIPTLLIVAAAYAIDNGTAKYQEIPGVTKKPNPIMIEGDEKTVPENKGILVPDSEQSVKHGSARSIFNRAYTRLRK